jgi:hypothetical protein
VTVISFTVELCGGLKYYPTLLSHCGSEPPAQKSVNKLDMTEFSNTIKRKPQAASRKPQAASRKPQAASRKPQAA